MRSFIGHVCTFIIRRLLTSKSCSMAVFYLDGTAFPYLSMYTAKARGAIIACLAVSVYKMHHLNVSALTVESFILALAHLMLRWES